MSDEEILSTTRGCVFKHGASVALDVIARVLQVTAPALLRRFGNRENLMFAALKPPTPEKLAVAVQTPPDTRSLEVQIEERMVWVWEFLSEVIPCVMALREHGVSPEKMCQWSEGPQKIIEAWEGWLTQARAQGLFAQAPIGTAATAMLGAVQARVLGAHLMGQPFELSYHRAYLHDLSLLFARALRASL